MEGRRFVFDGRHSPLGDARLENLGRLHIFNTSLFSDGGLRKGYLTYGTRYIVSERKNVFVPFLVRRASEPAFEFLPQNRR